MYTYCLLLREFWRVSLSTRRSKIHLLGVFLSCLMSGTRFVDNSTDIPTKPGRFLRWAPPSFLTGLPARFSLYVYYIT